MQYNVILVAISKYSGLFHKNPDLLLSKIYYPVVLSLIPTRATSWQKQSSALRNILQKKSLATIWIYITMATDTF